MAAEATEGVEQMSVGKLRRSRGSELAYPHVCGLHQLAKY